MNFQTTILLGVFLVFLLRLGATPAEAQERIWKDSSGKHEINAEFVKLEEGKVYLKRRSTDKKTGEKKIVTIAIELEQLSEADQQLVKELVANTNEPEISTDKDPNLDGSNNGETTDENPTSTEPPTEEANPPKMEDPTNDVIPTGSNGTDTPGSESNDPTLNGTATTSGNATTNPVTAGTSSNDSQTTRPVIIAPTASNAAVDNSFDSNFQSSIDIERVNQLQPPYKSAALALHKRLSTLQVGNAFQVLASVESPPQVVIDLVRETADSPNKYLRMESIKLLALHDPVKSFDKILEAATDNQSFDVRWTALELIEYLNDERAIDTLIHRFSGRDRSKILKVLTSFGSQVEDPLFALLDHENRNVITDAIRLLGKIGTEKSVEKITPLLDAENTSVRMQAKSALREIHARLNN